MSAVDIYIKQNCKVKEPVSLFWTICFMQPEHLKILNLYIFQQFFKNKQNVERIHSIGQVNY